MNTDIAAERLASQRITRPESRDPEDVVTWLGAVQAQDYPSAKWALALRMLDGATAAGIERCFNDGRILRTHLMRPTWHFVAVSDIHWMLELTASRVQRALAYAYRQFGLDSATRIRGTRVIERVLSAGQHLTRVELGAHLARMGVAVKGVGLALLTVHAELERVVCSGPQRGKQLTYALLAQRASRPKRLSRDEALGELAKRYFRSHAPATIRDFAWWSGLTITDARRGLEICGGRQEVIDDLTYWRLKRTKARELRPRVVHLLPAYDEYLVAYRDLDAVPRAKGARGTLEQALVTGGQITGTWKAIPKGNEVVVDVATMRSLTVTERRALFETAARYGRFLERPVSVSGQLERS